jgi:hypothetical protein
MVFHTSGLGRWFLAVDGEVVSHGGWRGGFSRWMERWFLMVDGEVVSHLGWRGGFSHGGRKGFVRGDLVFFLGGLSALVFLESIRQWIAQL